jgi:hypothetical protein
MANRNSGKATRSRLEQFRAMEKDATDPFAARLIHEIVAGLETRLGDLHLLNENVGEGTGEQKSEIDRLYCRRQGR